MEKKNIPELRFKGFEDEWEELPLSKYADFSKGRGYTKNDLRPIGNEIILYGMMYTDYKLAYTEIDTYAYKKNNSVISTGVEVIVPASGETAKEISIASAVLKKGVILGGDLNIIKPDDNIDPLFLAMSISHGEVKKELTKMAEGATISHLRNNNLKTINILAPLIKEQEKISKIFINLDKKLELEKEKHKKLKDFKKSMLEDMFPKEGESIPKLRFDGFHNKWEKIEIGNLGNIITGTTPSTRNENNYGGKYLFVSPIDIGKNRYIENTVTNLSKIGFSKGRILKEGATLFVSIGSTIGKVGQLRNKAVTNQQINSIEPFKDFDKDFIFVLMESNSNRIKENSATQAVPIINKARFSSIKIYITNNIKEQEKIGNFFKNLDKKIEASEEKIKKIEDFKKSLMEKMFV